ncbi:MAG: hypothetical protein K2K81_01510 [Muribaculaceae bacterium]|nr:hypothetical protein [Muribaculaceae bacterium]
MNKTLLTLSLAVTGISSAFAYWLPNPEIVSVVKEDGKVSLEWTYDQSIEKCNEFQVVVFKKHIATEDENFVLAKTDFSNIESKGTLDKSEERGAIWDFVQDCPGWWVKMPKYMNNALGIDAFMYFAGSDNSDIFGGAYLVSPDYDLSALSDPTFKVKAQIANEAVSVSGGFAIWAWNTNWMDPKNIDYKPVYGLDFHYDDLSFYNWKDISETCTFPLEEDFEDPDDKDEVRAIQHDRTRVMFYGVGYSTYWLNGFEVSVDLKKGESVDYGAEAYFVEGNTITIDTSSDTPDDYVYAYEVRAIYSQYDDYREITTIRATNYPYNTPKYVLGAQSGIADSNVIDNDVNLKVVNGTIVVEGAMNETVKVFNTAGVCVYEGSETESIKVDQGIYIVKVGTHTFKIAL